MKKLVSVLAAVVAMVLGTSSVAHADGNFQSTSTTGRAVAHYQDWTGVISACDWGFNDGDGAWIRWQVGSGSWHSTFVYNDCHRVRDNVPDGVWVSMQACDWVYIAGRGRTAVNCGFTAYTYSS
jgi:hypothetical protein